MALDETPLTPDWWLLRLGKALRAREQGVIDPDDREALPRGLAFWRLYWRGHHPLPAAPKDVKDSFAAFMRAARTNFCSVVVDADAHRLTVIGVTDDQGEPDDQAWYWWQANRLDSRQKGVYRTSLGQSVAYVMVGPDPRGRRDPNGDPVPLITAEHPRECIVEDDPATGERIAGLKAWHDSVTRRGRAVVYLGPERVRVEYQTVNEQHATALRWGVSTWERVTDEESSPLGVPIVPFPCMGDIGEEPRPVFDPIIDIQNRLNLSMLSRMTAERYSAWRQKYVTGHRFARTVDPVTGLEVPDQPFIPGPDNVWVSEGTDTKFGEFSQTDLMGFLKTHESDVRDLLVVTSTPAYYVASQLVNLSADAVSALDVNHIAKVAEFATVYGEAWEEVLTLAAELVGVERDFTSIEVRWRDPRSINPAVLADAAVKRSSIGYPLAILAEDLGESPQRIERIRAEAASGALLAGLAAPAAPAAPVPSGQSAPAPAPGAPAPNAPARGTGSPVPAGAPGAAS